MKRNSLLTLCLSFFIVLSLLLSYFHIFDAGIFYNLVLNIDPEDTTQVVDQDVYNSDFYENNARTTLANTLYPIQVVVNEPEEVFVINNEDLISRLISQLRSQQLQVTQATIIDDLDQYYQQISEDHVQFVFATDFPVVTMDHYLDIDENQTPAYTFNRILLPLISGETAYLVNSKSQSFLEVSLSDEALGESIYELAQDERDLWLEADRFPIANDDFVYLPLRNQTLTTEEYLVQYIPETTYTNLVFSNHTSRFIRMTPTQSDSVNTYQSLDAILSFDTQSQTANIEYTTNGTQSRMNFDQRIRQSLDYVSEYDFWEDGIRFSSQVNNVITYRRLLNGYPIYYHDSGSPYGSSKVYLVSNDLNSSSTIERFQTTAVRLFAHVEDQANPVELESADEIVFILNQHGFQLADFTQINIGYQWRMDEANHTRVRFEPKWYFKYQNTFYTIDQIEAGTLEVVETTAQENTTDSVDVSQASQSAIQVANHSQFIKGGVTIGL